MSTLEELKQRIEGLEALVSRTGLQGAGFLRGALRWRLCDKDKDGDMDPLTSTSWEGTSFSTGTGTINWHTTFGVPPEARAVFLSVMVRDSDSTAGQYSISFSTRSATTTPSFRALAPRSVNNAMGQADGMVGIDRVGSTYYSITASGDSTLDVWIRVIAYAV